MSAAGGNGGPSVRLRAVKDSSEPPSLGIAEWMREVRRLCAVLKQTPEGAMLGAVSVEHVTIQPPSGQMRITWRATCGLATAETDNPETAMQAVLAKLSAQLEERIKVQSEQLARLQEARRRGLKIAEGE